MGQEITVVQQVRQTLDKMRPELVSVLPAHLPVEAFVRITQTALQQNPDLQQCSVRSVVAAATKCAEAGLQPDGEEAALVAYNVKVSKRGEPDRWEKQAKFLPMVRGIRNQVIRSGMVKDWKVRIVYSQDKFRHIDGDVEVLEHEPAYAEGDYPVLVYSIGYLENGEISRHVMRMATVNKIRARSRSKDNGPWVTDTDEMIKKTCLKQHGKALPKAKEDLARQRIETSLRALDEAEGVLEVEHSPATDAPRLASHEAATQRLREAVETSAFDDPADDRFAGAVDAQSTPVQPEQPKRTRAPRKSPSERLAEAEGRKPSAPLREQLEASVEAERGNGRSAPAAAAQQQAAPSLSTPEPAGQSVSSAANAESPFDPDAYQDDGRDYAFEDEMRAEPAGFRDQAPEPASGQEREDRAAFRDGWNTRFQGKVRVPPRTLDQAKLVQAWMNGYDSAQKTIDLGNTPGSPQASKIMCDNLISRLYP